MAELTVFNYRPGSSILHRLDVRVKIFLMICISLVSLQAPYLQLGILTGVLFGLCFNAGLCLKSSIYELRYFSVLLIFIFLARALSTVGSPVFKLSFINISQEGLIDGALVCWRLLVVVFLGLLFIATTRSSQIKAAVQWFLKPVPWIPEAKVATMISLTARFVPVILNQANETAAAQRARLVENRKNPVFRLIILGIPLIRRTFENADNLAIAMEARCYTENRTDPVLEFSKKDGGILSLALLFCIFLLFL